MEIYSQRCTRIYLLKHNQLPYTPFLHVKYLDAFVKLFAFSQIAPQQDAVTGEVRSVIFNNGLSIASDSKEITIARVIVEPRKITFDIVEASEYLDDIYEKVKQFFIGIFESSEPDHLVPIIESNESEIVSHLEISPLKLFPSAFLDQVIPAGLASASYDFAEAKLGALQTLFQLDYVVPDPSILNSTRINLVRKEFLIQTAIGRAISEKIFASKAPLTTEDHVSFLEKLEKALVEK